MKRYKCIGRKENYAIAWSNQFAIGSVYEEASVFGIKNSDVTLFLFNKNRVSFFVDKDQFEECIN